MVVLLTGGLFFRPVVESSSARTSTGITETKPRRKALLIGISRYDSPSFPKLEYPLNDVARLSELLRSDKYGFTVTEVSDTSGIKPTRANILAAIRRVLIDEAEAGDEILFYYSGHGSSIRNTLSDEPDLRDETIVPSDAVRPVTNAAALKDIRDKELAELFNLSLNKKVVLTAIFDSCHSGSISRGDEQAKEAVAIDVDIKTPPKGPDQINKPDDRGALIITAAEDFEQAGGGTYSLAGKQAKYSHLTAMLLTVLYTIPADQISAEGLFQKITSQLKGRARTQTPTMAGTPDRFERTIFGGETAGSNGRIRVRATTLKEGFRTVKYLQGGRADGLAEGVELRRIVESTGKDTEPPLKVRVKNAGLSLSEYETVGEGVTVNDGDTFEQTTWVADSDPGLAVWLPAALLSAAEIREAIAEVAKLEADATLKVVAEPTDEKPSNFVYVEEEKTKPVWMMSFADGRIVRLGNKLSAQSVTAALIDRKVVSPKVFVSIPPAPELRAAIEAGIRETAGRVVMAASRGDAQYELVGRKKDSVAAYAWMLRSALAPENDAVKAAIDKATLSKASLKGDVAVPEVSMPAVTDWIGSDRADYDSGTLRNLAFKLGKISGLMKLSSPISVGTGRFPYRMEIRETAARRRLTPSDLLRPGIGYDFVLKLVARPGRTQGAEPLPSFYAYLISIDSNGRSYAFPAAKFGVPGGIEFDPENPKPELMVMPGLKLSRNSSFGTETLILLVTNKALENPASLNFSGVRKVTGNEKGGPVDPLQSLLADMGAQVSTKGNTSPDTWLVQQITMRSVGQ